MKNCKAFAAMQQLQFLLFFTIIIDNILAAQEFGNSNLTHINFSTTTTTSGALPEERAPYRSHKYKATPELPATASPYGTLPPASDNNNHSPYYGGGYNTCDGGARPLGRPCYQTCQCTEATLYSYCNQDKCACYAGFVSVNNNSLCLTTVATLGGACTDNAQCVQPNTICSTTRRVCECGSGLNATTSGTCELALNFAPNQTFSVMCCANASQVVGQLLPTSSAIDPITLTYTVVDDSSVTVTPQGNVVVAAGSNLQTDKTVQIIVKENSAPQQTTTATITLTPDACCSQQLSPAELRVPTAFLGRENCQTNLLVLFDFNALTRRTDPETAPIPVPNICGSAVSVNVSPGTAIQTQFSSTRTDTCASVFAVNAQNQIVVANSRGVSGAASGGGDGELYCTVAGTTTSCSGTVTIIDVKFSVLYSCS